MKITAASLVLNALIIGSACVVPSTAEYSDDASTYPAVKTYVNTAEAKREVRAAMALVIIADDNADIVGYGTASHVGNGIFLTAKHVVLDAVHVLLRPFNSEDPIPVEVIYESDYDLSLIRCSELKDMAKVEIADSPAKVAEECYSYGFFPHGEYNELWFNEGVVRSTSPDMFVISENIWFGHSGGAILNDDLEVIGVISYMFGDDKHIVPGAGATVPVHLIQDKIDEYTAT